MCINVIYKHARNPYIICMHVSECSERERRYDSENNTYIICFEQKEATLVAY